MVVNGVQKGREQVTTMQRPRTQIGGAMLNRGVLTKERDEYDEFVDERDEKKGWNFARIGLHLKRKKVHYVVAFVLVSCIRNIFGRKFIQIKARSCEFVASFPFKLKHRLLGFARSSEK